MAHPPIPPVRIPASKIAVPELPAEFTPRPAAPGPPGPGHPRPGRRRQRTRRIRARRCCWRTGCAPPRRRRDRLGRPRPGRQRTPPALVGRRLRAAGPPVGRSGRPPAAGRRRRGPAGRRGRRRVPRRCAGHPRVPGAPRPRRPARADRPRGAARSHPADPPQPARACSWSSPAGWIPRSRSPGSGWRDGCTRSAPTPSGSPSTTPPRCSRPPASTLTPAQVADLHARTEGWAAGLRLAALALRRSDDPAAFLTSFSGDERSVAEYLTGRDPRRPRPGHPGLPPGGQRVLPAAGRARGRAVRTSRRGLAARRARPGDRAHRVARPAPTTASTRCSAPTSSPISPATSPRRTGNSRPSPPGGGRHGSSPCTPCGTPSGPATAS